HQNFISRYSGRINTGAASGREHNIQLLGRAERCLADKAAIQGSGQVSRRAVNVEAQILLEIRRPGTVADLTHANPDIDRSQAKRSRQGVTPCLDAVDRALNGGQTTDPNRAEAGTGHV